MPNPYHDHSNGRFTTKGGGGGSGSGGSSAAPQWKVGDKVRNRHRTGHYGKVEELEAKGDVVVVRWNDGTYSQEDPTSILPEDVARKHEAAQEMLVRKHEAARALAKHVRARKG